MEEAVFMVKLFMFFLQISDRQFGIRIQYIKYILGKLMSEVQNSRGDRCTVATELSYQTHYVIVLS